MTSNYDAVNRDESYLWSDMRSLYLLFFLQILDFGLARVLSDGIQTGYVATR
jgi:hypothetical protein